VQAEFACSDARLDRVFHAGMRTMQLCAHETFEDCPHYEQMQYAGDTMITSKLGMLTSGDTRLTRQAVLHFDWSRLADGLTQSRFPSRLVQIIPSWSLHWITCVRDLALCGGDLATAREVWHGIRSVLDWFRRHADADGLPAKLPYWNVTDWCPWWPRGVVPGAADGPVCILGAQFITALDETAELARLLGRDDEAAALTREADGLRTALHRRFWSEEEGLYFDRPGGPEVSQYGNAWAIACGAADARTRERILARFPGDEKLAPGSFFCWHLVFRALRLSGQYDRMPDFLGPWHESIDAGLDTFVEENSYWRSLCHAWSAHPVLECLQGVLGVTPAAPGFASIRVAPQRCGLAWARGRVCTPRGLVEVAWRQDEQGFHVEGTGPADTPLTLVAPDGRELTFPGGAFTAIF
jgi:alpha-L-rhamnosidase